MTAFLDEAQVEMWAVEVLRGLGYEYVPGGELACDGPRPERSSYADVVLDGRLRAALARINPQVPDEALDEVVRRLNRAEHAGLVENNRRFHRLAVDGLTIECRAADGAIVYETVWLMVFEHPQDDDFLVANQVTVCCDRCTRRADLVIFVNGLPLAVIELKNPADESATLRTAYNQLQTYKAEQEALFATNELLIVSDGLEARAGSLTADWDRFLPWRTVDGSELAGPKAQLEVALRGLLEPGRFCELIRSFIVFEETRGGLVKKMAAYHQYHAVNKALGCTLRAAKSDRRIGVVWHTQGSGKSLSMAFFAGRVIRDPAMANPTVVVLTDRNDLDDQLFNTFAGCKELLRQTPVQAESRSHLRELLRVASGGVIFTTIQKFLRDGTDESPELLSDRRNIVVIADEAHRSQYDFVDGYARHMRDALPLASFVGFTGTPIEAADRSTPAVFGDYIDVYDIQQAVEDKATVPIYYEGRLARLELDPAERPRIDPEFEEVTEGQEQGTRERLKTRWASLEAMVGTEKRIGLIAADLVAHFEERTAALEGKGMVVCMSRRICVDLYNAIIRLRPQWHNADDESGAVKVVMTGAAGDALEWQQHIRNKERRARLADRFKNPDDPLRLVIVRDMWLTGFDCPCLHTLYVDKPMRGHGLMQAIARVNRVFRDKPGGLVVDYLGIAEQLRRALADYTASGGRGDTTIDQEDAVAVLMDKHAIVVAMFHGFDYRAVIEGPASGRTTGAAAAMNHILGLADGKPRYMQAVGELSKAFALAVPHEKALAIRDEVGFFQVVRAALAKMSAGGPGRSREEIDAAIRQIVSRAVASDQVVDVLAAAGLKKPDLSIFSEEFLEEVRALPHRNLAAELLQQLLSEQVKNQARRNLVQARSFAEMLEKTIAAYHNRSIEAAEVISQLIELARQLRQAARRGDELGLSEDEVAFYDALAVNDSAVKILGDDALRAIARELVARIRKSVTVDWARRESTRAAMRVMIKRILREYKYPPDKAEAATETVLKQAELMCLDLAA